MLVRALWLTLCVCALVAAQANPPLTFGNLIDDTVLPCQTKSYDLTVSTNGFLSNDYITIMLNQTNYDSETELSVTAMGQTCSTDGMNACYLYFTACQVWNSVWTVSVVGAQANEVSYELSALTTLAPVQNLVFGQNLTLTNNPVTTGGTSSPSTRYLYVALPVTQAQASTPGAQFSVTITYANNQIGTVLYAVGALPLTNVPNTNCTYVSLGCTNVGPCTGTINSCNIEAGLYIFAITVNTAITAANPVGVSATLTLPTSTVITIGQPVFNSLTANQVNYYSFPVVAGSGDLSVTIYNVENGPMTVNVAAGVLPASCLPNGLSCVGTVTCEVLIPACNLIAETYYFSVTAGTQATPARPITSTVVVNFANGVTPTPLTNGVSTTGTVQNNAYVSYSLPAWSGANQVMTVYLYVESITDNSKMTIVPVGSGSPLCTATYPTGNAIIAQCTPYGINGFCAVQIDSCTYADGQYVVNIQGTTQTGYPVISTYTIQATIGSATQLTNADAILTNSVPQSGYNQFIIPQSMLTMGASLEVTFSGVTAMGAGGSISIYQNYGGPAGIQCDHNCYANINPNPTTVAVGATATIPITVCAPVTGDLYLGVRGVNSYMSYFVQLTIPDTTATFTPLAAPASTVEAELPAVPSSTPGATTTTDYYDASALVPAAGTQGYLSLTLISTTEGLTLSLFNPEALQSACIGGSIQTCAVGVSGACNIMLLPCQFPEFSSESFVFVVEVSGKPESAYNLQYAAYGFASSALAANTPVVGSLAVNEFNYYSFSGLTAGNSLIVSAYIDNNVANAEMNLYVSTDPDMGNPTCLNNPTPIVACDSTDLQGVCNYVVDSCGAELGTYYIAVMRTSAAPYNQDISYTLTVEVAPSQMWVTFDPTQPINMQLWAGQTAYITTVLPASAANDLSIITFEVGNTVGTSTAQLASGYGANQCPCPQYVNTPQTISVGGQFYYSELESCMPGFATTGAYSLVLTNGTGGNPTQGFTIRAWGQPSTATALATGGSIQNTLSYRQYAFYTVTSAAATWTTISVTVSTTTGGDVNIFAGTTLATANCADEAANGLTIQLPPCSDMRAYTNIGVQGVPATSGGVTYTISNTQTAFDQMARDSNLGTFSLSASSPYRVAQLTVLTYVNVLAAITLSGANTAGSVSMYITTDPCAFILAGQQQAQLALYQCSTQGTTSCTINIAGCDPPTEQLYVVVVYGFGTQSGLQYSLLTTSAAASSLTPTPMMITLGSNAWFHYTVPAQAGNLNQLTVSVVPATVGGSMPQIFSNWNSAAWANNCPAQAGSCTSQTTCTIFVDTCCLATGTYYIGVYNNLGTAVTYNISATVAPAYVSAGALAFPTGSVTINNPTMNVLNMVTIPIPFLNTDQVVTLEFVTTTGAFTVYGQAGSPAGSDAPCYTNQQQFSCLQSGATCTIQFYPCTTEPQTYYFAVVANAVGMASITVTSTSQIPQPLTTNIFSYTVNANALYQLNYSATAVTPFDTFTVNIGVSSGQIAAYVNEGGMAGPPATSVCLQYGGPSQTCPSSPTICTISNVPICNNPGGFYIGLQAGTINAGGQLNVTVSTPFPTVIPNTGATEYELDLLGGDVEYYSVALPSSYSTVTATVQNATGGTFTLNAAVNTRCANPAPATCTANTNTPNCTIVLDPCTLSSLLAVNDGPPRVFFQLTATAAANITGTLIFNISTPPVQAMNGASAILGTLVAGQVAIYAIDVDALPVAVGQTVNVVIDDISCGEVSVITTQSLQQIGYPQQAMCLKPNCQNSPCPIALSTTCGQYPLGSGVTYVIISATPQYAPWNVPVSYSIYTQTVGTALEATAMVSNQAYNVSSPATQYFIYTAPGQAIVGSTGVITFTVTLPPNSFPLSTTTSISTTSPTQCGGGGGNLKTCRGSCSISYPACIQGGNGPYFISFSATSMPGLVISVSLGNPNLDTMSGTDFYNVSGAVAQTSTAQNVFFATAAFEYYAVSLPNPIPPLFYLQASLTNAFDNLPAYVQMWGTLNQYAPVCNSLPNGAQTYTLEWCQVDQAATLYLGIGASGTTNSAPSITPYTLTVDITADPIIVFMGSTCLGSFPANEPPTYYAVQQTLTSTQYLQFVFAGLNEDAQILITNGNIATPTCAGTMGVSAVCKLDDMGQCTVTWSCPAASAWFYFTLSGHGGSSPTVTISTQTFTTTPLTANTLTYLFAENVIPSGTVTFSYTLPAVAAGSYINITTNQQAFTYSFDVPQSSAPCNSAFIDCTTANMCFCGVGGECSLVLSSYQLAGHTTLYIYYYSSPSANNWVVVSAPTALPASLGKLSTAAQVTAVLGMGQIAVWELDLPANPSTATVSLNVYGLTALTAYLWVTAPDATTNGAGFLDSAFFSQGLAALGENEVSIGCGLQGQTYFVVVMAIPSVDICAPIAFSLLPEIVVPTTPVQTIAAAATPVIGYLGWNISEAVFQYAVPAGTNLFQVQIINSWGGAVQYQVTGPGQSVTQQPEPCGFMTTNSVYCQDTAGTYTITFMVVQPVVETLYSVSFSFAVYNQAVTALAVGTNAGTLTGIGVYNVYTFTVEATQGAMITIAAPGLVRYLLVPYTCADVLGNEPVAAAVCIQGPCVLEFTTLGSALAPGTYGLGVASANGVASVDITLQLGSGMCSNYGSSVCPASNAPVINYYAYMNLAAGVTGSPDPAVETLYHNLLTGFAAAAPTSGCNPEPGAISQTCSDALLGFACAVTHPTCQSGGLTAEICLDTCNGVVNACGYSFTQAGFPQYDCAHNYYVPFEAGITDVYCTGCIYNADGVCNGPIIQPEPAKKSGLSAGAIVGIVIGVLVVIGAGVLIFFFVRRGRRQSYAQAEAAGYQQTAQTEGAEYRSIGKDQSTANQRLKQNSPSTSAAGYGSTGGTPAGAATGAAATATASASGAASTPAASTSTAASKPATATATTAAPAKTTPAATETSKPAQSGAPATASATGSGSVSAGGATSASGAASAAGKPATTAATATTAPPASTTTAAPAAKTEPAAAPKIKPPPPADAPTGKAAPTAATATSPAAATTPETPATPQTPREDDEKAPLTGGSKGDKE